MQLIPINEVEPEELLQYFKELVVLDDQRVERPEDVAKISLVDEQRWIDSLIQRTVKQEGVSFCIKSSEGVIGVGEVERRPRWIERHVGEIRFGIFPLHKLEGKLLVDALVSGAKEIGITILYYFHLQSQVQGIEIMLESGFSPAGRIKNYYKVGGGYVDRIFLERSL